MVETQFAALLAPGSPTYNVLQSQINTANVDHESLLQQSVELEIRLNDSVTQGHWKYIPHLIADVDANLYCVDSLAAFLEVY